MDELVEFDALKTKVLKYVLYKKRTEYEIRLKFKDVSENMLDDVIDYLKELGYINDNNYIERAVNEFMYLRTLSIKEISYKLFSKGLSSKIIDDYFEKNEEKLEEYEKKCAKKIYIKKSSNLDKKDIIIFLKKKGYREESINYAIEEE